MQEPLPHWYRIAEQVVSSGEKKKQAYSITVEGSKGIHLSIHPSRATVTVERTADVRTLSAVDLVSPVQAVGFSVAHKQRVQRSAAAAATAAAALLSGPHCQDMNSFTKGCPGPEGREPE